MELTAVDCRFSGLGRFKVDDAKRLVVEADKAVNLFAMFARSVSNKRRDRARSFFFPG